jgi:hypothetical protein
LAIVQSGLGQEQIELDFGVRTGVPFTVPFESQLTGAEAVFSSQAFSRPRVSVGPAVTAVVHDRIAIQFDALYKRSTFDNSFFNETSFISASSRVSSWEFPLIADYAILKRPVRPFAGGGILLGDTYPGRFLSQSCPHSSSMAVWNCAHRACSSAQNFDIRAGAASRNRRILPAVKTSLNISSGSRFELYSGSDMQRFLFFFTVTLFSITGTAFGQPRLAFDFGVRVGIPTNTLLESDFSGIPGLFTRQQSFKRPDSTAGPTIAAVLYDRVIVQFDALYKPVHFLTKDTLTTAVISQSTRGGSWEFPLVFDYRFLHGKVRPYAGGGSVVGQTMSGVTESQTTSFNTGRIDRTFAQFNIFDNQFPAYVANAGVEWNATHVAVRPEVRYTRWDNTNSDLNRRRDQLDFLIGFSFR